MIFLLVGIKARTPSAAMRGQDVGVQPKKVNDIFGKCNKPIRQTSSHRVILPVESD